jgi:glucose-6-phosphate 1-dehydrogenase
MTGDSTLYARADAVKASWKFVDPVLQEWNENPDIPLYSYPCNTWGPEESNLLFDDKYIRWREPGDNINEG